MKKGRDYTRKILLSALAKEEQQVGAWAEVYPRAYWVVAIKGKVAYLREIGPLE